MMNTEQIRSIIIGTNNQDDFLEFSPHCLEDSMMNLLQNWYRDTDILDTDEEKVIALMEHTEEDYTECESFIEQGDYLVLEDEEADVAWEESIENYVDECVLPELNERYRHYFDTDKFMDDCKYDGRGHSLSSYDGHEIEVTIKDTDYYIYRIN